MEFHISKKIRDEYQFDSSLFELTGNVIFTDIHAARQFAQKWNQLNPRHTLKASNLFAMGLIDEILHYVVSLYKKQINPEVIKNAMTYIKQDIGDEQSDTTIREFVLEFPPVSVYQNNILVDVYLSRKTSNESHKTIEFEELLMLWLANNNPAFSSFSKLFDDHTLRKKTSYLKIIDNLIDYFESQPGFGPENESLITLLRKPAMAAPHSLKEQLEYIERKWSHLLSDFIKKILSSLDFIKEELKVALPGPGPLHVYTYDNSELDWEQYSEDLDWMPKVVMIAKNIYVWLDQLSKKYQRDIRQLDQIPNEELKILAQHGFTALWLIGLWERSSASGKIKQMMGNPDAVASAYSLKDYTIAADLGGESAYQNLKDRAWKYHVRMAGDMVPNHMGLDSNWIINHPDWFISVSQCPYPSYTFNGPDLSPDGRVGIYIEDHYYDKTDAAVVFKRIDHETGDIRYIYHGNDGTSMPWNDTAQLNYLDPEAREAVIKTIVHVARQFPIIRFDAAMTLVKKHIQRLWFPEPGHGGAIPSRSEHGISKADFDQHIPNEFWREVVDRITEEAPDTLLLAEAFWLLEGYFVRTLGMHRVYNSAFMNMLKMEENAKYREVIKNTLVFDPQILKRFVNFMNNPDEDTAIAQFGKGDKYFGVCVMLATMPGLPMFGHGQIEGFEEKYGMEFQRAYWNESPDNGLIDRHKREIFPLLRKRYLFAEVDHFVLYDLFTNDGHVNEDVFAYSNRIGDERALVVYHNKFSNAQGWIKMSVGIARKANQGDENQIVQKYLGEGLDLHNEEHYYSIFKESTTELEYIRPSQEFFSSGLYVELGAYKFQIFRDFVEIYDEKNIYSELAESLNGNGVPSINDALQALKLKPIHDPFRRLLYSSHLNQAIEELNLDAISEKEIPVQEILQLKFRFIKAFNAFIGHPEKSDQKLPPSPSGLSEIKNQLIELLKYIEKKNKSFAHYFSVCFEQCYTSQLLILYPILNEVQYIINEKLQEPNVIQWLQKYGIDSVLFHYFKQLGLDDEISDTTIATLKLWLKYPDWYVEEKYPSFLVTLFSDPDFTQLLRIHEFNDISWFNKEAFENSLKGLFVIAMVEMIKENQKSPSLLYNRLLKLYKVNVQYQKAAEELNYQVDKFIQIISQIIE